MVGVYIYGHPWALRYHLDLKWANESNAGHFKMIIHTPSTFNILLMNYIEFCTYSCFLWTKIKMRVPGLVWSAMYQSLEDGSTVPTYMWLSYLFALNVTSYTSMLFGCFLIHIQQENTPGDRQEKRKKDLHEWQMRKHKYTVTKSQTKRSNKSGTWNKRKERVTKAVKHFFISLLSTDSCCILWTSLNQTTAHSLYRVMHTKQLFTATSWPYNKSRSTHVPIQSFHDWSVKTNRQSSFSLLLDGAATGQSVDPLAS